MKQSLKLFFLTGILFSCQDGVLPREIQNDSEALDTKCEIEFVQASITGDKNLTIDVSSNSVHTINSYSSPSGIHVEGIQNGNSLKVDIKYYNGPGEYDISFSNTVIIELITGENESVTYKATNGAITLQEFVSPDNEICIKGVFTIDASNSDLSSSISIVNGEFEATVS